MVEIPCRFDFCPGHLETKGLGANVSGAFFLSQCQLGAVIVAALFLRRMPFK